MSGTSAPDCRSTVSRTSGSPLGALPTCSDPTGMSFSASVCCSSSKRSAVPARAIMTGTEWEWPRKRASSRQNSVRVMSTQRGSDKSHPIGVAAQARAYADRGDGPHAGGGGQASDTSAVAHDRARSEKAHAGGYLGRDSGGVGLLAEAEAGQGVHGRADGHQHVGAQARGPVSPLPLPSHQASKDGGRHQLGQNVSH